MLENDIRLSVKAALDEDLGHQDAHSSISLSQRCDADITAQLIPADRILYFSPNDGWKPLCDFLDKSIPTQKLPISGNNDAISRVHKKLIFNKSTRGQFLIVLYFLVLIGLFIYLGFFY